MRSGPEATARFGAFELKVSCDDRLAERKQQSARQVRAILASRIDLGFELWKSQSAAGTRTVST